jgi:cytochrome c5
LARHFSQERNRQVVVKKILLIISGLAFAAGIAQLSGASVENEIAARLAKEGSVCVEGEDCAAATASATMVADAGGAGGAEKIYNTSCATCHAMAIAGAPKFGDVEAWAPRIAKGMDVLYQSSINGMPPAMPAKGMCFQCTDDELKAVVDYMVNAAR